MPDCAVCEEPLRDPEDKNESGHWREGHRECMDSCGGRDERRSPEQWLADEDAPEGWSDE